MVQKQQSVSGDDNSGTIDNIRKTVHIHPALPEVVSTAAADLHGMIQTKNINCLLDHFRTLQSVCGPLDQ